MRWIRPTDTIEYKNSNLWEDIYTIEGWYCISSDEGKITSEFYLKNYKVLVSAFYKNYYCHLNQKSYSSKEEVNRLLKLLVFL